MLPSVPADFDLQAAFLTAPNGHKDRRLVDAVYPWKSGKSRFATANPKFGAGSVVFIGSASFRILADRRSSARSGRGSVHRVWSVA